jgi:hypothetical protein
MGRLGRYHPVTVIVTVLTCIDVTGWSAKNKYINYNDKNQNKIAVIHSFTEFNLCAEDCPS